MGRFVNPDNSAFQIALNSKIYIDKTMLLDYTNQVMDTDHGTAFIPNEEIRSELASAIEEEQWNEFLEFQQKK